MKKPLLLILSFVLTLFACQQVRYTENSPEIDTSKAILKAYHEGDWDAFEQAYADTARIHHNSVDAISIGEALAGLQEILEPFSEYGFGDDVEYEFITTDGGDQWVSWWGVWTATIAANGQELQIPVHASQKYVDGKIATEWSYWDNQPIVAALTAIQEASEEDVEEE